MHILIIAAGFVLWYLAYDAKPFSSDEVTDLWQEKNILKRNRLQDIIKEGF